MPQLPDHLRIYAVGDIHGRADLLAELVELIKADASSHAAVENRLVFLGDYVDRGPDSHGVIKLLLHDVPVGMTAQFLMGNHERLMLDAWADVKRFPLWIANGGKATEESYVRAALLLDGPEAGPPTTEGLVPPRHWLFFETLQLQAQHGDYLFVHAGIRPGVPLAEQDPHDLLWIREPFLSHQGSHGLVRSSWLSDDDFPYASIR